MARIGPCEPSSTLLIVAHVLRTSTFTGESRWHNSLLACPWDLETKGDHLLGCVLEVDQKRENPKVKRSVLGN